MFRFARLLNLLLVVTLLLTLQPAPVWSVWLEQDVRHANLPAALPTEPEQAQPTAPAPALTLTRVQSAQRSADLPSNTLVVTMTVRNALPPLTLPDIPEGATFTDTVALINDFDYGNDPNTIRNAVVADTVNSDVTVVDASAVGDRNGDTFLWQLGDIPPKSEQSLVVTLTLPTTEGFATFDAGAEAWGTLHGRSVSAETTPINLVPDDFGQWLISTLDANTTDPYMLTQLAEIGTDADSIFAWVQSLDYEAYSGSLRGTRGTLWSEAGNSADQSSLLIAMLRAAGIPARYRHGSLSAENAQTLIAAMFPPVPGTFGSVPEGFPVSDPVADTDLVNLARDHWWVEAYTPGTGWVDMDPSFPDATIGQQFATVGAGDRSAELPDTARHKVTTRLTVETFSAIGQLQTTVPLSHTYRTVELVGNPITLAHLVAGEGSGGLIFTSGELTYTPYFTSGDQQVIGDTYQELFTNFAGASQIITGLFWQFDLTAPDGSSEQHTRALVDRLGPAVRLNGGTPDLAFDEIAPIVRETALFQANISTSRTPVAAYERLIEPLLAENLQLIEAAGALQMADDSADTGELERQVAVAYREWGEILLTSLTTNFGTQSDEMNRFMAERQLVKQYLAAPRLLLADVQISAEGNPQVQLDLLKNDGLQAIAYPGQTRTTESAFHSARGIFDSNVEGNVLAALGFANALDAPTIIRTALLQPNTELVGITANNLDELAALDLPDDAKALMRRAALDGKIVSVPSQMVTIDEVTTIAWYEIDPDTGLAIGVMENGLHGAFIYGSLAEIGAHLAGFLGGFSGSFFSGIMGYITTIFELLESGEPLDTKQLAIRAFKDFVVVYAELAEEAVGKIENDILSALAGGIVDGIKDALGFEEPPETLATRLADAVDNLIATLADMIKSRIPITDSIEVGKVTGAGAAVAILLIAVEEDPPLPDSLIALPPNTDAMQLTVTGTIDMAANVNGTAFSGTVTGRSALAVAGTDAVSLFAPPLSGLAPGGDGAAFSAEPFTPNASFSAETILLEQATGTLNTLTLPAAIALRDYNGTLTITEADATTDQFVVNGTGAVTTLRVAPTNSQTVPGAAVLFSAEIETSIPDSFQLTAHAPEGWHLELDTRQITALPPAGAAAGEYRIDIILQSLTDSGVILSVSHLVQVAEHDGATLEIIPEPLITAAWGGNGTLGSHINNGNVQLPNAVYSLQLTNVSNRTQTFDLSVENLPAGWAVLNGEQANSTPITLAAGQVARVSLAVLPTGAALPAPGSSYPFTARATAGAVTAEAQETFVVAAIGYPHLQLTEETLFAAPDSAVTATWAITNVGNLATSFIVTTTVSQVDAPDTSLPVASAVQTVATAPDTPQQRSVQIDTTGATVGESYLIRAATAINAYEPATVALLQISSAEATCTAATADALQPYSPLITAALNNTAFRLNDLAATGYSDLAQRDAVLTALDAVAAAVADDYPPVSTANLLAIRNTLAAATGSSAIENALSNVCTVLADLQADIELFHEHRFAAAFTPTRYVALSGQPVAYQLTIANTSVSASTYEVTITKPDGTETWSPTLAVGAEATRAIVTTAGAPGEGVVSAEITSLDNGTPVTLTRQQPTATLEVVAALAEITMLAVDPAFVASGDNSAEITLRIANHTYRTLDTAATIELLDADGTRAYSRTVDRDILGGRNRLYDLGTVSVAGLENGAYQLRVTFRDADGATVTAASTGLTVGEGLVVAHRVTPLEVPLGTSTVQMEIATELGAGRSAEPDCRSIRKTGIPACSDTGRMPVLRSPSTSPIRRYEESDPALQYTGDWLDFDSFAASGGSTRAPLGESTVSLTFTGAWFGIGLDAIPGATWQLELDGTPLGSYTAPDTEDNIVNQYFSVAPGNHTVTLRTDSAYIDFFDVWNGEESAAGFYDATRDDTGGQVHFNDLSVSWGAVAEPSAYGGDYLSAEFGLDVPASAWFLFTGDAVTVHTYSQDPSFDAPPARLDVYIDGEFVEQITVESAFSPKPFPFRFDGLGEGAHAIRIVNVENGHLDAFETRPDGITRYAPRIEWYSAEPAVETSDDEFAEEGIVSSIMLGDINQDEVVEMVIASSNGRLYLYHADGAGVDQGEKQLWMREYGIIGEPTLADLDGDGNAEIITVGTQGVRVVDAAGETVWHNADVTSFFSDCCSVIGWGGATVGNLDNDPQPEIVIAAHGNGLYVFEADGTIAWSVEPADAEFNYLYPSVPVLADLTGDGKLDILAAQDETLTLYDYADGGTVEWQYEVGLGTGFADSWGSPAVADVDGDGAPEIVMAWPDRIEMYEADGTRVWQYMAADSEVPGDTSIGDVDGDGVLDIVATISGPIIVGAPYHRIFVLNADGSLKWNRKVYDFTGSSSGVTLHDLNSDGAMELIWNGGEGGEPFIVPENFPSGLTIFDGVAGEVLYNEPFINSTTIIDYPTIADVDGDGHAEIVAGDKEGVYIVGFDEQWSPARPLWTDHNYHVTNILNDFSVPFTEENSWELHNTYRTQTPRRDPFATYGVVVTHTLIVENQTVVDGSFSAEPETPPPALRWSYEQPAGEYAITFDTEISNMHPGEVRQLTTGTEVAFDLPSGAGTLQLPPLYVTAPSIIGVTPARQTAAVGNEISYMVTLTNPTNAALTYALTVNGVPESWLPAPLSIQVAPGSQTVAVTFAVPNDAVETAYTLEFVAALPSGEQDVAVAELVVIEPFALRVAPEVIEANAGATVTFTAIITNFESVERTYTVETLTRESVTIPAGQSGSVQFSAHAPLLEGGYLWQVEADNGVFARSAPMLVLVNGSRSAEITLDPQSQPVGRGTAAVYGVTLVNTGSLSDTYTLNATVPAGFSAEFQTNGTAVESVFLTPFAFNARTLDFVLTAPANATPGSYDFTITAESSGGVVVAVAGSAVVGNRGVQVQFVQDVTTVAPDDSAEWDVIVTNTGLVADTFTLAALGIIAPVADFAPASVTLDPGQSETVSLTADPLNFAVESRYQVGVTAQSTTVETVQDTDAATLRFAPQVAVEVAWQPAVQTTNGLSTTGYTLVFTNTGNTLADFTVSFDAPTVDLVGQPPLLTVPPNATARIPVSVTPEVGGRHHFAATVSSGIASDSATATLITTGVPQLIYLPLVQNDFCVQQDLHVDVMLVIDRSGSMDDPTEDGGLSKMDAAKDAAVHFLYFMDFPQDQVGVVSFGNDATLESRLSSNQAALTTAINGIEIAGTTRLDLGLLTAQEEVLSNRHINANLPAIILMTDGKPNGVTAAEVLAVADQVKAAGIDLYTIGLGDDINDSLMREVASSAENYYRSPSADQLDKVYEQIANALFCE